MGKRKKQNGQYHHTHVAYFRNMKNSKNSILLIENVTEYKEDLVKKELGPEWTLVSIRMDPRCLGLPCSRARVLWCVGRSRKFDGLPHLHYVLSLERCAPES